MIKKLIETRIPVRLTLAGANVTGMTEANMASGNITVYDAAGNETDISITTGGNWFELNSTKAPALYHFVLPGQASEGPIQWIVRANAGEFDTFYGSDTIDGTQAAITTAQTALALFIATTTQLITGPAYVQATDSLNAISTRMVDTSDLTSAVNDIKGPGGFNISDVITQLTTNAGAVAGAVWDELRAGHSGVGSFGEFIRIAQLVFMGHLKIDKLTNQLVMYQEDGVTVYKTFLLRDPNGMPTFQNVTERFAGV